MKNPLNSAFTPGPRFAQLLSLAILLLAFAMPLSAQVNSGSNGSDGAFNPATNIVINMADHPTGIYQYTSVSIPTNVIVTFISNVNNTPVTWLVQSNCEIDGTVDVSGHFETGTPYPTTPSWEIGGIGGPGGGAGGGGGNNPGSGQGPGGGGAPAADAGYGDNGRAVYGSGNGGAIYGNSFLLPLLGGSGGGGGGPYSSGGGGGGGAILIASSGTITLDGSIKAIGSNGFYSGSGSGGAVRLVCINLTGNGSINVLGGDGPGGDGRLRIDAFQNSFGGQIYGIFTYGFQPIIIPVPGQGVQLTIASVGGASISSTPTGQLVSPDAIISGQQANPIPIVVNCANLPLNTLVTVTVKPANGSPISAVGYNTSGSLASSIATVSLNMPRGGGIIYATAATSN